jgi:4-hydroxy-tetrahydrodipicolinate synthase
VEIPCIVYNVPSRTGLDIPVSVYRELAEIPNIAGIKEASGDIGKVSAVLAECPDLTLWTGNDDQIVPAMALGAKGVISVVSNILPVKTKALADAALDGDFDTAAALQLEMLPLMKALFSEVNPIPVKAAMEMIGFDCGPCRLPLTPMSNEKRAKLQQLLQLQ